MASAYSPIAISSPSASPPPSPEPTASTGRGSQSMRSQHVDILIMAMKTIDADTIDGAGRAAKELQDPDTYTSRDFFYAAYRLLVNLEWKFFDGTTEVDIFAPSVPQMVKRDFDIRFKHLVRYLKSCKNSCKIFLKPTTFMDDVLNNPQEMLRRFITNHKGYGNTKRKIQALAKAATLPPNKAASGAADGTPTPLSKRRARVEASDEVCTAPKRLRLSKDAREPGVAVEQNGEGEGGEGDDDGGVEYDETWV